MSESGFLTTLHEFEYTQHIIIKTNTRLNKSCRDYCIRKAKYIVELNIKEYVIFMNGGFEIVNVILKNNIRV